jgi:hypothetical protein
MLFVSPGVSIYRVGREDAGDLVGSTIDSKHAGLALTASKASSLTNFRISLTSRSRPRIQGEGMCSAARSGERASTDLSHLLYSVQSPGPHSIFFLILSEMVVFWLRC